MSDFSIFEALFETQGEESGKDKRNENQKGIKKSKPYIEILKIVRESISENNASELASYIADPEGEKLLKTLISKYVHQENLYCDEYEYDELIHKIYEDMAQFGFLTKYIFDDSVEEININAYNDIEIITNKGYFKLDEKYNSPKECIDSIKKMCAFGGVVIDASQPSKDSFITKGIRISANIAPVVDEEDGGSASIRRQKKDPITKEQLIEWDTITEDEIDFLSICTQSRISLAISGATGSGKTTLLGYILKSLPDSFRIYTIEDSRELDLRKYDENGNVINRVVHNKIRPHINPESNIDSEYLMVKSLRFNSDITATAEMRSSEAWTAQEAARTGSTNITTLHANSAKDAYMRMTTMSKEKSQGSTTAEVMNLFIEAFPIVASMEQLIDKSRKCMSIIEAVGYDAALGKLNYKTIYQFVITGKKVIDGKVKIIGKHKKIDNISPRLARQMLKCGIDENVINKFAGEAWKDEEIY